MLESTCNKFADLKDCSLIKENSFLRIAFFINHPRWLLLNKVKTSLKSTCFYCLTDYTMLLSLLRHSIQNIVQNYKDTGTETQRKGNTKNQNIERRKPSFTKRVG